MTISIYQAATVERAEIITRALNQGGFPHRFMSGGNLVYIQWGSGSVPSCLRTKFKDVITGINMAMDLLQPSA